MWNEGSIICVDCSKRNDIGRLGVLWGCDNKTEVQGLISILPSIICPKHKSPLSVCWPSKFLSSPLVCGWKPYLYLTSIFIICLYLLFLTLDVNSAARVCFLEYIYNSFYLKFFKESLLPSRKIPECLAHFMINLWLPFQPHLFFNYDLQKNIYCIFLPSISGNLNQ